MKRPLITALGSTLCALLCILLITLALASPVPTASTPTDLDWPAFWQQFWADHQSLTWVTVGDSITAGDLDYTQGGQYYFRWMEQRLREMGKTVTVIDPAVGGTHLTQFNDNCGAWVDPYSPQLVTVLFGGNDGFADQQEIRAAFDRLLEKLVPTPENVSRGVPADRVVVLIACYPIQFGPESEGEMRSVHAYGQELSLRWSARGYPVQYIDLYTLFGENYPYGEEGRFSSLGEYMDPVSGVHADLAGQYAIAQLLMKEMGLYSEESPLCTIPHDGLEGEHTARRLSLNYALAGSAPTELLPAREESPFLSGTVLVLGGADTAGECLSSDPLQAWPQLVEAAVRCRLQQTDLRFVTVARRECTPEWVHRSLLTMVEASGWPDQILYMPTPAGIEEAGYVHTPAALEDYEAALTAVAEVCREMGIPLTLLTPIPLSGEEDRILAGYVEVIRRVAERQEVPLCDVYAVLHAAMTRSPAAARSWYSDGAPGYMAHVETARILLYWGGSRRTFFDYPCYLPALR